MFRHDLIPGHLPIDQLRDESNNRLNTRPNLFRRISLTESHGSILNGLKVDCDGKGGPELVIPGVSAANRLGGVVDFVGDALRPETSDCKSS